MTETTADIMRSDSLRRRATSSAVAPVSGPVVLGVVAMVDLVAILASSGLALVFYIVVWLNEDGIPLDRYALITVLGGLVNAIVLHQTGAYQFKRLGSLSWQVPRVAGAWTGTLSLGIVLSFLTKSSEQYSRGWSVAWLLIGLGLLVSNRVALAVLFRHWARIGRLSRSVVIVGGGEQGARLIRKLLAIPDDSIRVIGVFDDRRSRIPAEIAGCPVLGTTDDLLRFARQSPPDEVIVALPLQAELRLQVLFRKLMLLPIDLRLSFDAIGEHLPVRGVSHIGEIPVVDVVDKPLKHWSAVLKWLEDKVLAGLLLAATSPLLLLISIALKLDSRGPVFFRQERFGFNNEVIRVFKFRTMFADKGDQSGAQRTIRNDPRVTRLGKWLRMLSLDELPQLINVLRGDMSLVGPRPHAIAMRAGDRLYHDAVDEYFARHRVRPGLTGWAQVHGLRGETDTIEKARRRVEYDLYYIDNWSLWLDLKILLMTFRVFYSHDNAY